jgi:hypothetical protein
MSTRALRDMAIGGSIATFGDLLCQTFVEERGVAALDLRRTAEMAAVRAFLMTPFLTWYFPFLSRTIPGQSWARVIARVCVDQSIAAPLTIAATFTATSALRGKLGDAPARIETQLLPTWRNSASFWPIVHLFNFRYVPPTLQPLVAHFVSVPWNAVLSYRANASLAPPQEAVAAVSLEA